MQVLLLLLLVGGVRKKNAIKRCWCNCGVSFPVLTSATSTGAHYSSNHEGCWFD